MPPCASNDRPLRHRDDPDLRPHGGRDDLACAPTGSPHPRRVVVRRHCSRVEEKPSPAGLFCWAPTALAATTSAITAGFIDETFPQYAGLDAAGARCAARRGVATQARASG